METKQPQLVKKSRMEAAVAALVIAMGIAVSSAVLAQDSSAKPSTPPIADKPPVSDKMGMGAGGSGMMGMTGMMSGMQQMKCCGQGMGHADHGASEKQDEKK